MGARRVKGRFAFSNGGRDVPIFYKLKIRTATRWGLMDEILQCLSRSGVGIVEFRTETEGEFSGYEGFLKDQTLKGLAGGLDPPGLPERLAAIRASLVRNPLSKPIQFRNPNSVAARRARALSLA